MSEKRLDDRYSTPERFTTNKGIHAEAHKRLSEVVWNYLNCGTGDEITMRANTADFDRPRYKTPLFAGISNPDTSTTFLGHSLAFPALIAPFGGGEHLFHEDGHIATGRAAAAVGVRQIVPIAAAHSLEAIAEATGVAQMFQVTFVGEVDSVLQIIERAKTAGYEQIVATYSPIRQWRERLIEDRFQITGPGGDANYGEGKSDVGMLREQLDFTQPRWGWEKAKEVFKASPLPIIMKGVMTAEEATQSLEAGALGLYVSNYGGRTIDRQPSTISVLPQIRSAVGPDVPIVFDSGVRRGSDIATAVALGANAVALGRAAAYGLAAAGEYGVRRVLEILKLEFWTTLGHLGCSSIKELGAHVFMEPPF